MQTITFKCPEKLAKQLSKESLYRKIGKSDLLRQALEFYLSQKWHSSDRKSFYALSKDLCGAIDSSEDLSENPVYLQGYGD